MKRALLVVAVVCSVHVAVAKPLPAGMKVEFVAAKKDMGGTIVVSQRGVSFTVDAPTMMIDKLLSAELSEDGASLVIRAQRCYDSEAFEPFEAKLPLASVDAKIENLLGMQLHAKKKYADAIAHFTIAAQKAPDVAMYATNLLSAQAMAGKLDDADRTIATYAPRNRPWFLWRLAVDPELKVIAGRPSAKLGAAKPGTATSKLHEAFTHEHGEVAYSPLGIVAREVYEPSEYGGSPIRPTSYAIVFVDLKTNTELLQLSTETTCAPVFGGEETKEHKTCVKQMAAAAKQSRAVADRVMRELGFAIAGEHHSIDEKQLVAKDGRVLELGEHPHVKHGGQDRPFTLPENAFGEHLWFVPGGVVFESHRKVVDTCSGDGTLTYYVSAVETP